MTNSRLENLYEETISKFSNNVAIEFYDLSQEGCDKVSKRYVLYSELEAVATQFSHAVTCFKVSKGTLCGIFMDPCLELPLCILGVLKAHCAYVPLDITSTSESLYKKMKGIGIQIMISTAENEGALQDAFKDLTHEMSTFEVMFGKELVRLNIYKVSAKQRSSSSQAKPRRHEIAYVMSTSGTTGEPKTIAVPHSCILPNILHLSKIFGINECSRICMSAPATFDPSVVEMFIAFANGATLILPSKRIKINPHCLCKVLFDIAKVTCLQATPSLLKRFAINDLREKAFNPASALKVMAFGGEACPFHSTIRSWIKADAVERTLKSISFFNLYGITEVSCWATCHRISTANISQGNQCGIPIGGPLLDTNLQLRSEEDNILLCTIRGPTATVTTVTYEINDVLANRIVMPEDGVKVRVTAKMYIGGSRRVCYITGQESTNYRCSGDLVTLRITTDKKIELHFNGRVDSVVKRNGKSVNLEEVTAKIEGLPDVQSCNTVNANVCIHGESTQTIIAFIIRQCQKNHPFRRDECVVIDSQVSKSWTFTCFQTASKKLPPSCVPDHFIEINRVPTTAHGKVDERCLTALFEKHKSKIRSKSVSENTLREALKKILPHCLPSGTFTEHEFEKRWSKLLELTFPQIGGSSIEAVALLNWLGVFSGTSIVAAMPEALTCLFTEPLEKFLSSLALALGHKFLVDTKSCISSLKREQSAPQKLIVQKWAKLASTECFIEKNFERCTPCSSGENPAVSGHFCGRAITSNLTCKQLEVIKRWKYNTCKCVDATPLVVGTDQTCGICFIGSHSHKFSAVSMATGSLIWSQTLPDRIESSACALSSDHVAVGCYDGNVYFFNMHSGKIEWHYPTGALVKCSPCAGVPNNSIVYVGSHDGHMYALDGKEKLCIWKSHCGGGAVFSSPCVRKSPVEEKIVVYVGTLGGIVVSICGRAGDIMWITRLGMPVFSSPCVSDAGICIGCVDNSVYMLSHVSGEKLWHFDTEKPVFSSPRLSVDGESVVVGSHDGRVYRLRVPDGSLLWMSANFGSPIYSTPSTFLVSSIGKEFVAFAATDGSLLIADMKDGRVVASEKLPGEIFSSPFVVPTITDGSSGSLLCSGDMCAELLVGCRNDYLYCYAIKLKI